MSEPPSNWNEIMGDKVFWDMVLAFKKSDKVWLKTEIDDEDDGQQHELALDFVKSEGMLVFSLYFMNYHWRPASATVQELAGSTMSPTGPIRSSSAAPMRPSKRALGSSSHAAMAIPSPVLPRAGFLPSVCSSFAQRPLELTTSLRSTASCTS